MMQEDSARNALLGPGLVEEELISSEAWLIRIRWWAGLGVLGATWFTTSVLALTLPAVPLYVNGLAILAYNAVLRVVLARRLVAVPRVVRAFENLAKLQIGLDWLAMTLLIHFSGGVESPVILYFFFHIIIASTLLSPRATYIYAGLATVLVGTTVGLEYAGWLPHLGVREFIVAPLYRNPVYVSGIMVFFTSAMFVAVYMASTLNSRLRGREAEVVQLGQRLQRAYGRLQTLYEGAQTVNSTLDLHQVLDRLVRGTAEAMGVRACSIRLLDETGTRLHVDAVYGLSQAYVQKGDLILERNPLAREALAGKTVIIGDVSQDARLQYPAEAEAEGIRSILTARLYGKNAPLGLIRAYSAEPNHFTEDDATFLTAIANQGSLAIENAMAYQTLGQLDEMKSKFVLTITHELRSPVSVVRSLLRTITGGYVGTLTSEQADIIARALRRADYLQTLIDDLLDLASGKSELSSSAERVQVQLAEAVERVVKRLEVPAQEKQVKLTWLCSSDDQPIKVWAVTEDVDRILNNLVSNAIKYTPSGGSVTVTLRRAGGYAHLKVVDTGIGIPEDSLPRLFEEFYRAPNAKAQVKEGTGLGLAITKSLVTRYGGRIGVESKVGEGTTFAVILPVIGESSAQLC
jgi:signal transduction histidine kinase